MSFYYFIVGKHHPPVSMQLTLFKLACVYFSIRPYIDSFSLEIIVYKVSNKSSLLDI